MKVAVSWSGGKDAALALETVRDEHEVDSLPTTFSENGRSKMHGVRRSAVERQADAVGLPLRRVVVPGGASNEDYEERMGAALADLYDDGVDAVVFGDVFLEDVRAYREEMTPDRLDTVFPVWGEDTDLLAERVRRDYRAVTVCVSDSLGAEYLGESYDEGFVSSLPDTVDPCGENGEFHTFVVDAPYFRRPVEYETGEVVRREPGGSVYHYCDIVPSEVSMPEGKPTSDPPTDYQ